MKTLPLRQYHERLGARWRMWQGWEVVQSYGDSINEYQTLTTHVAVADLSVLGVIRIQGRDAEDYLHRQLTNAVSSLKVGEGCHACFLTGIGQMIAEMTLHRTGDAEFLALTMPSCADALVEALDQMIFSEDCRVTHEPAGSACLVLAGPRAPESLQSVLGISAESIAEWGCCTITRGASEMIVVRTSSLAVPAFALLAPPRLAEMVWDELISCGAEPIGLKALNTLRIETGIPLFGEDHDATWNPMDAGIEAAISFTKGCFPGQEAVGKIHNLSHPRQVLRGFVCGGAAAPMLGEEVTVDGKSVGQITSVCHSPRLQRFIALGHLKWGARETTGPVQLGEIPIAAEVVGLPFQG